MSCQEELDRMERKAWRFIWTAYVAGCAAGLLSGWLLWGQS